MIALLITVSGFAFSYQISHGDEFILKNSRNCFLVSNKSCKQPIQIFCKGQIAAEVESCSHRKGEINNASLAAHNLMIEFGFKLDQSFSLQDTDFSSYTK